jgi:hypothetical protein
MPQKKITNKNKKSIWAKKHPNRFIFMRASMAKIGIHNGKFAPLKTAAAVDVGKITLKKTAGKHKTFRKLQAVEQNSTPPKSHRPLVKINFGPNGSPESGDTPGGTKLPCYYSNGPMYFFNNMTELSPYSNKYVITEIDATHPFLQSKEYSLIKKHFSVTKEREVLITQRLIKSKKNHSRRKQLQNPTMAVSGRSHEGSANDYFQELVLDVQLKAEWLHLFLYSIAGEKGQIPENLTCGTAYANTDMIPIENMLKRLAALYPEGIRLTIKSNFVKVNNGNNQNEHLQVGTYMQYVISTPHIEIPFNFNIQNKRQAHISNQYYVDELFQAMLAAAQLQTPEKKTSARRSLSNSLFYFVKPEPTLTHTEEQPHSKTTKTTKRPRDNK